MHSVMGYDPMLLESSLPYPETLDKTVLDARAQEVQEVLLLEDAVHENVIDAGLGCMDVTETVGMEVAPCELDAIGEQRGGAETESTQEQGPNTVTKADGNGKIVEQLHEGSDHGGSPLKSLAGGADVRANAKGSGGKKRRKDRGEDWTGEETGILLKAVSQKSKVKSRLGKGSGVSESWWEAIAKEVPNRTGNECRRRMDTLKKAYNAAMKYCDNHQKEFKELKKEDFRLMKLATRLTESWYYSIRYHCPPRSNKKTGNKGAGSSLAKGVPVLSGRPSPNRVPTSLSNGPLGERGPLAAELRNHSAESTEVVVPTPDAVTQSKPPVAACEVVLSLVLHRFPSLFFLFSFPSSLGGSSFESRRSKAREKYGTGIEESF